FSPDGRHLALGSASGVISILRLAQAERPMKTDKDLILGHWKPVSAEAFGMPVPQELIDLVQPRLTFTPDKLSAKVNLDKMPISLDTLKKLMKGFEEKALLPKELMAVLDKQSVEAVYVLNETKTPKTINIR